MTMKIDLAPASERELVLCRIINAPRHQVYRAWTDPVLLKKWFAPAPFTVPVAELDVRAGGGSFIVMRDPHGTDYPNRGVYLEVVPNQRLVFTDAYTTAWEPAEKPFFTGVLTFEEAGEGKTKYTARALHWTLADRDAHEKMGFHEGWGICTEQLEALASSL